MDPDKLKEDVAKHQRLLREGIYHGGEDNQPGKKKKPVDIADLDADMERRMREMKEEQRRRNAFDVRTPSEWMASARKKPKLSMLFSELWYEGEVCILFADTNLGKSILAVQVAESIASGKPIPGFQLEARPQKVLYIDFELSDTQFRRRYVNEFGEEYPFSANLMRAELQCREVRECFASMEEFIIYSLEQEIVETGAKVLVIDNITYLRSDNECARDAAPFMQELQAMKKRLGLSILAIAHTPKRDRTQPLDVKDVAGSSMLTNFCDSIFGIGPSQQDKSVRYIKQMKLRNNEHLYHEENVLVCRLEKQNNFLGFTFLEFGHERQHLKVRSEKDYSEIVAQVKALSAEGKSQKAIADELHISIGSVNRYLKM